MAEPALRILQVVTSPGVGGLELYVPALTRSLIEQGQKAWLLCRGETVVEQTARQWGLPAETTRMHGYFHLPAIFSLAAFLRKHQIQIIHAHWSRDLSNLILAADLAGGIPLLLTKHVYATENKHDPFHAWVYHRVKIVVAVSRLLSENVHQTVRMPRERIVTIYNGLDIDQIWNPGSVRQDIRSELGIPASAKVLGYAGRLNPGKGPHFILQAFLALAAEHPDWHLAFVGKAVGAGEEQYAADLQSQVIACGMKTRVHFCGFRSNMPEVMRTFDVFANASEFETFGMVVAEAMAMECPVIGPDSGGIPEIIADNHCGYLYAPRNLNDFTAKLRLLFLDAQLRRRMGQAGRKRVAECFEMKQSTQAMISIYRQLINKPGV